MLSESNSICLDQSINNSFVLKRNIKVKSSKLPCDFFNSRQIQRYQPRKLSLKKSIAQANTRQTYTPSFERFEQLNASSREKDFLIQRKIGTARVNMSKDDTLIHDVIDTARNIKRVLRRKSLQMVRQSLNRNDVQLHLPKIKNSKEGRRIL